MIANRLVRQEGRAFERGSFFMPVYPAPAALPLLLVQLLEQLGDGLACLLAAAGRAHTDATGSRAAQLARASAAEAEKVLFSHVVHLLSVVLEHLEECVVDDAERQQRDAEHDKPLAAKGEVAAR